MGEQRKRLCIIINPSIGLYGLYRKQWYYWLKHGYDVHCIAGPGPEHKIVADMGVKTHVIPIQRYPSPLKDIISLVRLWWFLLWHRFEIVHVSTPKAGFLGALGGKLSGHRHLIYTVRGRPYENMIGWRRWLMNRCEWLTCHLASIVIPICHELGEVLVKERLCSAKKIHVIGSGSSRGIDLDQFTLTEEVIQTGRQLRDQLGIGKKDLVILFVGWLRKEKGTNELAHAFESLAEEYLNIHLLLLGNYEYTDPLETEVLSLIEKHDRIHRVQWLWEPSPIYSAADIFAFPSYREGFGNVVLEASAMELPVIATDVIGCREAVQDGVTGLLVAPGNVDALKKGLKRLVEDAALRKELGINGRRRVENEFKQQIIWQGILEQYQKLLEN
jgi:glycosyltransferase involved in cell wall biosynthesis